jgi:hypothetical protein
MMATTSGASSDTERGVAFRRALQQQRDRVLDCDALVDERRRDGDRAVEQLRVAVQERDREAAYLAYLVELAEAVAV